MTRASKLTVGDWIEVRRKEEIFATLDRKAQLDGMPFMPEMVKYCGQRFRIYKRAHKACDTVFPTRSRWVDDTVHLNTRCDGLAHGGCQAACLLFWKEAWLKPVANYAASDEDGESLKEERVHAGSVSGSGCTEVDVQKAIGTFDSKSGTPAYVCQATQLPYATRQLSWWDIRQYVEDYRSGNVDIWRMLRGLMYSSYYNLSQAGIGLGPAMRWLYDRFHPLRRGGLFPRHAGTIPVGQKTPTKALDLQSGELVRVKSHEEILKTLDSSSKNRGMSWDAEMVPYCGGTYRVLTRVNKIIDERTGKMQEMKTPGIILESVVCQSRYSGCRMFCPRSIYPYWREIWLERVDPSVSIAGRYGQLVSTVTKTSSYRDL